MTKYKIAVPELINQLRAGYLARQAVIGRRGIERFSGIFMKRLAPIPPIGLIVTLVPLFAFHSDVIIAHPLGIVLIAIPLILQTSLIFSSSTVGLRDGRRTTISRRLLA